MRRMRLYGVIRLGLLSLSLAGALPAQTRTIAERLGHPADTKLLIVHADDLGVAHSVNVASFDGLTTRAVSSASIMMGTPWVTEVAAYARAHPEADLGLHLTLTSEWKTYRWGSVAPANTVASLLDSTGTLPAETGPVATRAKLDEVERELRAQVDRALALGIRPTHLDSHMGALFTTPGLFATYAKVARAYGLPFLAPAGLPFPREPRDVVVDAVVTPGPEVPSDRWKAFYLDAIRNLKPGLTEIIVHLGRDDAELQAVTVDHEPWGSAWRQRDTEAMNSPELKAALRDNHVVVIGWRELQQLTRQP